MKKTYISPAVAEYGSIADCTFATPGMTGALKSNHPDFVSATPLGDGNYQCGTGSNAWGAGTPAGGGGKNHMVLQCDKFGEYSHS